ncbi:SapC family protein [Microbulbifer halophilus]|uniref:SapC family protein n=1 Tax=Microbulbifer halophilus TaxID=453963 RepID=A0ABW5EBN2_9GAMM|nr:SapC family protein [Microbulbifer halophilus]MCW8125856.1 SapC family protein [Microbulbifer halophilus]
MSKPVLLDNVTHKDLRVITRYGKEFGDNVNRTPVFPTEYADVQREYPILLRKDGDSGEYQSIALLGFAREENLFLEGGDWNASYIPGIVARGPFLIGFQQRDVDGEVQREPVIHVDMDSPRISETEGEPVFLPHGGNSPYLERVSTILGGINDGMEVGRTMFEALDSFGLIEPVNIQVEVHADEKYDLRGLYTISEEKLANLDGESLEKLNRAGFLQGAFLLIASLGNVKNLIDMKRRRLLAASER